MSYVKDIGNESTLLEKYPNSSMYNIVDFACQDMEPIHEDEKNSLFYKEVKYGYDFINLFSDIKDLAISEYRNRLKKKINNDRVF